MGIKADTYANWEKGKTEPVAAQFRPVAQFLGYDPSPVPRTLADRLTARRRALGITLSQVAQYLDWDEGTLRQYLKGTWQIPPARAAALEAFMTDRAVELSGPRCRRRR